MATITKNRPADTGSADGTGTTGATDTGALTITRMSPALGARVDGFDLTDVSPANIDQLNQLLLEHGVLFFRDTLLEPEQHQALAEGFGTPSVFPLSKLMAPPNAVLPTMGDIIDTEDDPPNADGWHTDITWIPKPPKIGILQAIEVPDSGGDTLWADLYLAYDNLSPVLQDFFATLSVRHQVSSPIVEAARRRGGDDLAKLLLDKFPPVSHPLVRTHPETQRQALFVAGEFMIGIDGMNEAESRALLGWLGSYINDPNLHVRWSWESGDMAIWDERRTNHRALSNHYPSYRHMRRCTVDGDKPYFELAA